MEAADAHALARAVKGLSIRLAKALNRLVCGHGQVRDPGTLSTKGLVSGADGRDPARS